MNPILRIAKKLSLTLIIALIVTYIGDYASVRYRIWKPRANDPFESLKLDRFYAITQKNGREDYEPADSQTVTCVHAIFPHSGFNPCWYVVRQNGKAIPMAILPTDFPRPALTIILPTNETFSAFLRLLTRGVAATGVRSGTL